MGRLKGRMGREGRSPRVECRPASGILRVFSILQLVSLKNRISLLVELAC